MHTIHYASQTGIVIIFKSIITISGVSEYCEQDERIIDNAIEENVFFTLREVIINSPIFHKEVDIIIIITVHTCYQ